MHGGEVEVSGHAKEAMKDGGSFATLKAGGGSFDALLLNEGEIGPLFTFEASWTIQFFKAGEHVKGPFQVPEFVHSFALLH